MLLGFPDGQLFQIRGVTVSIGGALRQAGGASGFDRRTPVQRGGHGAAHPAFLRRSTRCRYGTTKGRIAMRKLHTRMGWRRRQVSGRGVIRSGIIAPDGGHW